MTALRVKLGPGAKMPTRATDGSACLDICASAPATVHAGEAAPVSTGLHMQIEPGWCMLLFSRSGHGIRLANSVGVIDSDYRGEIIVGLRNDNWIRFDVKPGDRIAQALLVPVHEVEPDPGGRAVGDGARGWWARQHGCVMARPSKLSPEQWAGVERRL